MFRKAVVKQLQEDAQREQNNDTRNIDIDHDRFALLFNPATHHKEHRVDWYVNRNKDIRNTLNGLWNNGAGIINKKTMEGATTDQRTFSRINVLFRNMETRGGTGRTEFDSFKYDKKHDMYHCHVWDGQPTYVVMWEIDEENHVINIVDMGPHENFNYKRRHKKADAIDAALEARSEDQKYQEHKRRGLARS